MRIAVIVGSIRQGRNGLAVGQWVYQQAVQRGDAHFELVDLREFELPLVTSAVPPASADRQYDSAATMQWSQVIDSFDSYIFVTPEYNYGVPGAFKNAVDSLGMEWNRKPVAFVSYGGDGGVRSVQQWRQILVNFDMLDIRAAVALSLFRDFDADGFAPGQRRAAELDNLLNSLVALTSAVRPWRV